MIHGHSIIELTDVKTGEVERYEDDNLVTNGIKYYQRFYGLPTVIWKTVFGGVKIFENNIEENPDIVTAPAAANMIGYACDYSDTTDNMRGILNLDQSGILEDDSGIKLTWDFAQSQANGTIRCICVTPEGFAKNPFREMEAYNSSKLIGAYDMTQLDFDFIRRTAISYINEMKENSRIKVILNRVPYIYKGITDDGTGKKIGEFYVDIPVDFSNYKTTGSRIGADEQFYYFLAIKNYTTDKPAMTTFLLIKIKKETYEVTTQEFTFSDPAYPDVYFSTGYNSFVFNGYLYIVHDKKEYFKFEMRDYTLKKVITSPLIIKSLSRSNNFLAVGKNNVTGFYFIMGTDDSIRNSEFKNSVSSDEYSGGVLINLVGDVIFAGCSYSTYRKDAMYYYKVPIVMTINNLSTPVTKTADKTMKITYILKEDYGDTPQTP